MEIPTANNDPMSISEDLHTILLNGLQYFYKIMSNCVPMGIVSVGRGHGGRVVTLSPPTSEAGVRFLAWPQVGKLVVACRWSAVYSTEP